MPEQELRIHRVNNLDGGLISSISSRLLDQSAGMVGDIRNLSFDYPGIVNKRRGTENTFSSITGAIKGLFEFEKTSDNTSYVVIAVEHEGSLSYLYWDVDTSEWVSIIGGLNTAEPDFASFADQLVIANPEESLASWDGDTFSSTLGAAKAKLETFFVYSNNDLIFTAKEAGVNGNYIRIKIIEPEVDTATPSVATEGAQTSASPLLITITPAWNDVVPHKMKLFLDSPTGGQYQIGDPFGYRLLDYDATAATIETKLKEVYGSDKITSVEASVEVDVDFIITFNGVVNSYLRADFSGLEYADPETASPEVSEEQEYQDSEIVSTANEIKAMLEADATVNNLLDIEHISGSDGSGVVTTMRERALTGGYDAVKGAYLELFRGRLLLAGDSDDPNLLKGSHTGDPSLWDPSASGSNAFEMYVGPDDGTSITGLLELGDGGVLIGKHKSIYGLFGYTRDNFVVDLVDSQRGVVNHASMAFVKPYGLFVSSSAVYRYEAGSLPENISIPIQEIFEEEVDQTKLDQCSAVVRDREYILSLPAKEGDNIVLVYYVDGNRWTRWSEPTGKYFSDYSTVKDGFLYAPEEGTQVVLFGSDRGKDKGTAFESYLTTVELDAGLPEIDKYFGDLYIIFRTAEEDYNVSVEVTLNDNYNNVIATEEVIPGNSRKQKVLRVVVGREARFMEVTVRNEDGSKDFNPLAVLFTYRNMGVL